MKVRRADARFLLPRPVQTAAVIEPLAGWSETLEAAGVEVNGREAPDVAVAAAGDSARAFATGAGMVILEGRGGGRRLAAAGFDVMRYLARPQLESPEFFLPLQGAPGAYALRHWATEDRRWRRVRNRLLAEAAARGVLPEVVPGVAIGTRSGRVPYFVSAARERVAELPDAGWLLSLGRADALSRNVFHLFGAAEREPRLVVKFARSRGYDEPFVREEGGLRLAANAGPTVAAHAPRLLARFDVDGASASVETAAAGEPLKRYLSRPISRESKLAALSDVARWIVGVGAATSHGSDEPVVRRTAVENAPAVPDRRLLEEALAASGEVPAVLAHNDLGSWNVIRNESGGFVAVDWESAQPHGFPLWDLVYFLTEGLATADGAIEHGWEPYVRGLFRGTGESSRFLFDWIARGADAMSVSSDKVGPLVTLCWLHHSASTTQRREAMERHLIGGTTAVPPLERVAAFWLSDPELGPNWQQWRTVT
jgi:Phosphotransferase enzyme family